MVLESSRAPEDTAAAGNLLVRGPAEKSRPARGERFDESSTGSGVFSRDFLEIKGRKQDDVQFWWSCDRKV